MNYNCDHGLFLALNFDGGPVMDKAMLTISGTLMWLPLYALILYLAWRRAGWRNLLIFIACMILALVLSDMIAGIFKHTGVLKHLWPEFPPRLRPMFAPGLEGLAISPDSLETLRRTTATGAEWIVHTPQEALAGRYGTVSAHAATIIALGAISIPIIRRRWFTWLMVACTFVICYSRIYLAKHFPIDLLLGTGVGLLSGWVMLLIYNKLAQKKGAE